MGQFVMKRRLLVFFLNLRVFLFDWVVNWLTASENVGEKLAKGNHLLSQAVV